MEQAGAQICTGGGAIGSFPAEDVLEFRRSWGSMYCYQDRANTVSMPYACQYGNDF